MSRTTLCVIALASSGWLCACSSASMDVLPPTISVSIGQQLIDLKKARQAGALSEQEYQVQVRRVVDSVQ
ncbi:MAG: hypothetical protein ACRC2B_06245 [Rubrivivax sp.]